MQNRCINHCISGRETARAVPFYSSMSLIAGLGTPRVVVWPIMGGRATCREGGVNEDGTRVTAGKNKSLQNGAFRRTKRINHRRRRVNFVPVKAPLPNISVHIVETPWVRFVSGQQEKSSTHSIGRSQRCGQAAMVEQDCRHRECPRDTVNVVQQGTNVYPPRRSVRSTLLRSPAERGELSIELIRKCGFERIEQKVSVR